MVGLLERCCKVFGQQVDHPGRPLMLVAVKMDPSRNYVENPGYLALLR